GTERHDPVYNGLQEVNKKSDIVLRHDGARPFLKTKNISSSTI
ncbi:2-C-methyl-D-erythritol 4-phosphate cytidylyltransferase, partial [Caloranaerobacter azorensis]